MIWMLSLFAVVFFQTAQVSSFLVLSPRKPHDWTLQSASTSSSSTTTSTTTSSKSGNVLLPPTSPLPPHTFAGMVEARLLQKFGESSIKRILESWRWVDQDHEHKQFVGGNDRDGETSWCHQHCTSFVRDLTVKEFWDNETFDWTSKLASKYKSIKEEFARATLASSQLEQVGNNIWAGALTQDAASYGEGWKTLVLMDRGWWDPVNVNLFPVTAQAVRDAGVPAVEVFFTRLEPHSDIKPHTDFTNFVLTSHLAIDIPYSGQNKCRIRVGDVTREWINGEVMVFDTSLLHDAVNESDKMRYILMFRVWHPDLTAEEREALQLIYDCLNLPGLVSDDPTERIKAEILAESMKAFPKIEKGTQKIQGFGGSTASSSSSSKKKKKKKN